MRALGLWAALAAVACGACGDDGNDTIDGPLPADARIDGPPGPCPVNEAFFTGELLDWDSTNAAFLGVADAVFTVEGAPTRTDNTAPNGRFELCIPNARVVVNVDAPNTYLDGVIVVDQGELGGSIVSLRALTAARAASFFVERSLTYNPARAQLLSFQAVDRVALTIDRPADATQSADDDDGDGEYTWTAGNGGRFVLFPNVDVTQPNAVLSGDMTPHTVPLTAGELTWVVTSTVFL